MGREAYTSDELLTNAIKLSTGQAFSISPARPELAEGAHSTKVAVVVDEAKSVSDDLIDALEPVFAGGDALGLMTSTPGLPAGYFYNICSRKPGYTQWHHQRVTIEEAVRAGRVSQAWVDEKLAQWGRDSYLYKTYIAAEFGDQGAGAIIRLTDIERAIELGLDITLIGPPSSLGIDVTGGLTENVIAPIWRNYEHDGELVTVVGELVRPVTDNPAEVAAAAMEVVEGKKHIPIVVDVDGAGLGTYTALRDAGYNAVAFSGNRGSTAKDRTGIFGFTNIRSQSFWQLGERLKFDKIALPDDDKLKADLLMPTKTVVGDKIKLEGKDQIVRRLGRSTDAGDAVMYGLSDLAIHEHLEVRGGVKHDEFST